jgi:peptidoglycan/LPS O-acetylase OafA/YrhL
VLKELDKKDTAILKGLAISAIVLHNFFHVVIPVHENEFTFDPSRFPVFLQYLVRPSTSIQSLFAFYGHFGVQIFIFLSAYGLAKTHWEHSESWSSFIWSRVKKFYPMFGLAVLFWALLASLQVGPIALAKMTGLEVMLMLAGVSTIIPGMGLPPIGPWWFIPFIMQFYAMWLLLRKLTVKFGWPALLVLSVICFVISYFANPILAHWSINLNWTPIGCMRVICFGIIAARYPIRLNAYLAIPAFAIMILGSKYQSISYLCSLAIVIFSLWLYGRMRSLLRGFHSLEKIGDYSLAIFLFNGIVRVPFASLASTPLLQLVLACASAAVTFGISAWFQHLLGLVPKASNVSVWIKPARKTDEPCGMEPNSIPANRALSTHAL